MLSSNSLFTTAGDIWYSLKFNVTENTGNGYQNLDSVPSLDTIGKYQNIAVRGKNQLSGENPALLQKPDVGNLHF